MKRNLTLTLLLSSIVGLLASATAEDRPWKVFVLAGTSNMHGRNARIDDLPEDLHQPHQDVLVYQKGEWVPLEAGKNLVGNEATFGRAMTEHLGESIGIIRITVGKASERSPGANLHNIVKQAREKGRPIVIVGILLDVSFRDGKDEESAMAYQRNLTSWVESTRRDLGDPKLPIAMNRAIPPVPKTPYLESVRKAQDSLQLPGVRVFNCDDVTRGGDKIHFNTAGQLEMGKRFAAAMIELMKVDKQDN